MEVLALRVQMIPALAMEMVCCSYSFKEGRLSVKDQMKYHMDRGHSRTFTANNSQLWCSYYSVQTVTNTQLMVLLMILQEAVNPNVP